MTESTGRTPPNSRCAQLILHVHAIMRDGEWHNLEQIIKAVTPKVPRGLAARMCERDRTRAHQRLHGEHSLPPSRRLNDEIVRSGARTLIKQAIRSYEKNFEFNDQGDKFRLLKTPVRLIPYIPPDEVMGACPTCGRL